jgi:hypothetical protein
MDIFMQALRMIFEVLYDDGSHLSYGARGGQIRPFAVSYIATVSIIPVQKPRIKELDAPSRQ